MISNTEYKIDLELIEKAAELCKDWSGKNVLNMPTGDFFYDPWKISPHYKGTVFEELLNVLPDVGEARIIRQECGTCYQLHSDIDNRYHLNLSGDNAALIDVNNNMIYPLKADGNYYLMDAGRIHSAANFGQYPRYQLVVRCLLKRADWVTDSVEIVADGDNPRFIFDKYISPLLNEINARHAMNNFAVTSTGVKFKTNAFWIQHLHDVMPNKFSLLLR